MAERTISVTLPQLARMIDHSLLHPTMTDADDIAELQLAKRCIYVATACVKPHHDPLAKEQLEDCDVRVCPVIDFPHGDSTSAIQVLEAEQATESGGQEIDMVIKIGKAVVGDWEYVEADIREVNEAIVRHETIWKVIVETDYLQEMHIQRLCEICSKLKVALFKSSTGYGFVKQSNGMYSYRGAKVAHLKLMRA